jgi:transmembrane sensor
MGKVVRLTTRAEIEETASLWLSRLDRGLSSVEREEMAAWLALDARHGAAMIDLAQAWDRMESLRVLASLVDLRDLQDRRAALRQRQVALGGLVCAGIAAIALMRWDGLSRSSPSSLSAQRSEVRTLAPSGAGSWTTTLATDTGQRQVASLPDGSRVTLNTATTIRAGASSGARRVDLIKGEATFDVAHDANHPFIVFVGNQSVRAVGTTFNVRRRDDNSFYVLVTEGTVAVQPSPSTSSTSPQLLTAGERLDVSAGSTEIQTVSTADAMDTLAWHDGMIVFEGEPLAAALAEVSRYTNLRFVIEDGSLRDTRIAGVYRTDDLENFLQSLQANFDINAVQDADGAIRLSARPKNPAP